MSENLTNEQIQNGQNESGQTQQVQNEQTQKGKRGWFAIHTYTGYEEAVARYLKQRIESLGMENKIFNVLVPKEKKIKIRGGKRYVVEEKIYPGYVLVDMILAEDSWYVVRNTPRVTGFIGADSTKPTPLSPKEVEELFNRMGKDQVKYKISLKVGDLVKIIDGPFKDYEGKIAEVDEERGRIKVLVQLFGRETAIDLDSLQVKKLA
jgi:transcriptional antiterminator NusG